MFNELYLSPFYSKLTNFCVETVLPFTDINNTKYIIRIDVILKADILPLTLITLWLDTDILMELTINDA